MQPGFFLGLAANVGDGFAYEILPVKDYSDIPLQGCVFTVIQNILRQREITEYEALFVTFHDLVWQVTNQQGDIIGEEMVSVEDHHEQVNVSEETQLPEECHQRIFELQTTEERNPTVLTNTTLFTIPEEDEPLYSSTPVEIDPPEDSDHFVENVSDDIVICPQVNNIVVETCEEENHTAITNTDDADDDVPLVTQDSYESEDETNKTITSESYNTTNADILNDVFDPDVEAPKVTPIIAHQLNSGKLDFLCKYSDGNTD